MIPRVLHVLHAPDGGGIAQAALLAADATARGGTAILLAPPGIDATLQHRLGEQGVVVRSLPSHPVDRTRALWAATRETDVVHAHGARAAVWALPWLRRLPSVLTFHGLHRLRRPGPPARRAYGRGLTRLLAALPDAVVCVAHSERAELLAIGVSSASLRVVRNAVPERPPVDAEERGRSRRALGVEDEPFVIGFVGRLDPQKDPLLAVDAVGGMTPGEARLLVAGDGELKRRVEEAAARVANVSALGHVDARTVYAASDVVLSTSVWEGLPLSLLEAMWAGVPIVASDVPGNAEALGDAGVLVGSRRPEQFREALRALARPAVRAPLAESGRERVAREFPLAEMLAATSAVYADVLARTASGGAR